MNIGKLIGTSTSGIKVYREIVENGTQIISACKDGGIIKEIVRKPSVFNADFSSSFKTYIAKLDRDEFTAITHEFDKNGKAKSVHSKTFDWDINSGIETLKNSRRSKSVFQTFKERKLQEFVKTYITNTKHTTRTEKYVTRFKNGKSFDYNTETLTLKENGKPVATYHIIPGTFGLPPRKI